MVWIPQKVKPKAYHRAQSQGRGGGVGGNEVSDFSHMKLVRIQLELAMTRATTLSKALGRMRPGRSEAAHQRCLIQRTKVKVESENL